MSTSAIHNQQIDDDSLIFSHANDLGEAPGDGDEDESQDLKPGKTQPGRRRIDIEYVQDKARRHITFSKRKAGIMKKAFELSVLTGTQVLLLIVSESGLVYTYSTEKLQPIVVEKEGKDLIQRCLTTPQHPPESEEWSVDPSLPNPKGGKKDAFLRHYNPSTGSQNQYQRAYTSEANQGSSSQIDPRNFVPPDQMHLHAMGVDISGDVQALDGVEAVSMGIGGDDGGDIPVVIPDGSTSTIPMPNEMDVSMIQRALQTQTQGRRPPPPKANQARQRQAIGGASQSTMIDPALDNLQSQLFVQTSAAGQLDQAQAGRRGRPKKSDASVGIGKRKRDEDEFLHLDELDGEQGKEKRVRDELTG